MKTFKQLVSEIYEPNTPDEGKFINMHTIRTFDYPVKNDHGLPFRDDRIKGPGPQHKKPASYDPPKEPATAYTKANEETDQVDEQKTLYGTPAEYKRKLSLIAKKEKSLPPGISTARKSLAIQKQKVMASMKEDAENESIEEKKLTPAEIKKREEVAKAIQRDNPKMPMAMKMAIATKTAKRVAEESLEENYSKMDTDSLNSSFRRFSDSIMKSPKATMSNAGNAYGTIMDMHKELTKRGEKVELPKHRLFEPERRSMKNEESELRLLLGLNPEAEDSDDGVFETADMLSLLQIISDTDSSIEIFFEDSEEPVGFNKDVADVLLRAYESLDEESQVEFVEALSDSSQGFDHCVGFSLKLLEEESK